MKQNGKIRLTKLYLQRNKLVAVQKYLIKALNNAVIMDLLDDIQATPIKVEILQDIEQGQENFTGALMMFSGLVIIGGILLIMNIQMMNAEERTREIGIFRAIGGKKKDVMGLFAFEGLFVAMIGSFFAFNKEISCTITCLLTFIFSAIICPVTGSLFLLNHSKI